MLEPIRYRLRRDFEVLGERPNGGKIPGRYRLPQHSVLSLALHASPTRAGAAARSRYAGSCTESIPTLA
jgi:hypothetical protein